MTVGEILGELRSRARPGSLPAMARFGLSPGGRLGVSIPEVRLLARRIGRDHRLALQLWPTGIQEACILASMIADPGQTTVAQMNAWVRTFDAWDVCDQACMNLFVWTPHAWGRVRVWTRRKGEFQRRAGYALLACLAVKQKNAPDGRFAACLPFILRDASDERNYVKKAVSWALRQIGKRNARLRAAARTTARTLQRQGSRSARWIAADALSEITPAARPGRRRQR